MYKYKIVEIKLPLVKERTNELLNTPKLVHNICKDLENLSQETFQVLTLNVKNKLIERHTVSIGTATEAIIHSREVFRDAILDNAIAIILVHNHPSGDTTPSSVDTKITERMIKAGEILGIKVIDHVIIGKDCFCSFREKGLVTF